MQVQCCTVSWAEIDILQLDYACHSKGSMSLRVAQDVQQRDFKLPSWTC